MARVKSFRAESGVSVEVKGQWFKFYSAIEIELDAQDDTEDIKRKAWNTVNAEIEKQVLEVLN